MTAARTAPDESATKGTPTSPLRLLVITPLGVSTLPLPDGCRIVMGRGAQADLCLDDPLVSREHCRLECLDGRITLTDLGSSNGTRVRDQRLASHAPTAVRVNDLIEIASIQLMVQRPRRDASDTSRHDVIASASPMPAAPVAPVAGMRQSVVLEDPTMLGLRRLIERIAPGVISVMLLGETGVGKEVFAEMVHRLSRRADRAFVRLNCASLSETLLESELFGHEKGAFTGAVSTRAGLLESAHGGTVFIDEVGELPPAIQVKLLRVVEERRVTRVGSVQPREIDVRFVSATHRDLEESIAAERFRQDLYFRLNGISLEIPPLRARVSEIESLARLFLTEACKRSEIARVPTITPEAIALLRAYSWPGNLRELRNVMERAALLCADGRIGPEHLPLARAREPVVSPRAPVAPVAPSAPAGGTLRDELDALERGRIIDALTRCAGNQSRAARELGMSRRTFLDRLDAFGIARPRKSPREA